VGHGILGDEQRDLQQRQPDGRGDGHGDHHPRRELGIVLGSTTATSGYLGQTPGGLGFGYGNTSYFLWNNISGLTFNSALTVGGTSGTLTYYAYSGQSNYFVNATNTYMFALDFGAGNLWIGLNNAWLSGNPATGSNPTISGSALTGGTSYAPNGAGVHSAAFFYGTGRGPVTLTGHFSAATYKYTPPAGF
jgi:hypothetical protein